MTPEFISGLFTLVLYAMTVIVALAFLNQSRTQAGHISLLLVTSILVHGMFLYQVIDAAETQNLSLFNMMGMTNWLAMWVLLFNSMKRNVTLMVIIIACFAMISTGLELFYPGVSAVQLKGQWASLLHIFSAMTAMGFLLLATLQAILVAYADHRLRTHPMHIPVFFPPLQSLESFLFQLLVLGFLLMSGALFIAFVYLGDNPSQQPLHKLLLSIMAWITFAILLVGHKWKGWRGVTAAKWTISGFVLLSLGYFGSKLVLELILNK